ncbi:MAG TPA: aminotransferase class I/II-fold pyridoxal phosphate-dependent enzyme [Candidatus Elarobacter sp.]|jgi:threonine aldolase|nr:aminotransferase class I/II-fold pyridoxal phosphate-dependent enzyme [Candidatus Elarobacter sp.]
MMPSRHFASDNNAGVHPAVLAALAAVNEGHTSAYGDDQYTRRAEARFRELLGERARVFFAFNGTGANVVALAAALRPYQAVICPAGAHLNVDECGAYERFVGGKLIDVPVENGKLTPELVDAQIHGIGDQHHVQPGAISISQSTEVGTVYTVDELRALGETARKHGLLFHVDGARIANAIASLGTDARTMLTETGVDVCTFGGTKNGLMFGEAIVFPNGHPAADVLPFTRKQGMQLTSKMRFVAAQFEALLRDDLWLENARHANAMAQLLAARLRDLDDVIQLAYPVQANGVFPILPPDAIEPLMHERRFYMWDADEHIARWMTAWDTTAEDVHAFADAVWRIAPNEKKIPVTR